MGRTPRAEEQPNLLGVAALPMQPYSRAQATFALGIVRVGMLVGTMPWPALWSRLNSRDHVASLLHVGLGITRAARRRWAKYMALLLWARLHDVLIHHNVHSFS
jgi:hypothetical protein